MLTITFRGESRDLELIRGNVRFIHPDITIVPSESRFEVRLPEKEAEPMPKKAPIERSKSTVEKSNTTSAAPLKKVQSAGSSFFKSKPDKKPEKKKELPKKAVKKIEKKKVIESDDEKEETELITKLDQKERDEPKKQADMPPKEEPRKEQLTTEEKEVRSNQRSQILAMFEEDRSQMMDVADETSETQVLRF
jgi:hypothetical protein